jgi:hypothetical protein
MPANKLPRPSGFGGRSSAAGAADGGGEAAGFGGPEVGGGETAGFGGPPIAAKVKWEGLRRKKGNEERDCGICGIFVNETRRK